MVLNEKAFLEKEQNACLIQQGNSKKAFKKYEVKYGRKDGVGTDCERQGRKEASTLIRLSIKGGHKVNKNKQTNRKKPHICTWFQFTSPKLRSCTYFPYINTLNTPRLSEMTVGGRRHRHTSQLCRMQKHLL